MPGIQFIYMKAYQLSVHVYIFWGGHKYCPLHETLKAPVCVHLILNLNQHGSEKVGHALGVAIMGMGHCIVQQDIPNLK